VLASIGLLACSGQGESPPPSAHQAGSAGGKIVQEDLAVDPPPPTADAADGSDSVPSSPSPLSDAAVEPVDPATTPSEAVPGFDDSATPAPPSSDVGPEPDDPPPGREPIPTVLRMVERRGSCGDASFPREGEAPKVRVTTRRATVEIRLTDYRSYCSPAPRFQASRVGEDRIVLEELPVPPGTPIARCTCLHRIPLTIHDVPSGSYTLELATTHTTLREQITVPD
jgi:hypothetical protein